jgi:L-amino acid N-acyltransferase YncA
MEIRPLTARDREPLLRFLAAVPASDRTFFKEDVADADAVVRWAGGPGRHGLACDAGEVLGFVAVVPLPGWSDHVGEIRLVVHPDHRRAGVGRALARWALVQALDAGLRKLVVEVVAEQEGAVAMFTALGFDAEGLLRDHVRDRDGELRDLILLAHPVADQWSTMATVGLDEALQQK